MRILFVCDRSIDLPEFHLITRLAGHGFQPEVVLGDEGGSLRRLEAAGIATAPLTIRGRVDLRAIRTLRARLSTDAFALAHCLGGHKQISNLLLASAGRRLKRVAYRGTLGHLHRLDPSSWLSYLNPRIDHIVCASSAVRDYLAGLRIPPGKLSVIYKGHDPAWYTAAPRSRLTELGVPPEAFVVGCAARIRPVKGVDVLLRALQGPATGRPIHAVLAGRVDDPRVLELATSPGLRERVHLIGHRDDAPALMGACDLFVMPSLRREGMPRALIEALAQGVPAIVSRVGGMPELVRGGLEGLIVPPGQPAALAAAIVHLRDDEALRQAMGRNARARIAADFSIERTVERTIALYHALLP